MCLEGKQYYTIFILLISIAVYSQNNVPFDKKLFKDKKEQFNIAMDNLLDGNDYYADSSFNVALEYYLKANEFNPNNSDLNYKIGICYLNSINAAKAHEYFVKSYNLNNDPPKEIKYYIAMSHQSKLEFDKAIEEYKNFKISLSPNILYNWHPTIQKRLKECETGKELIKQPTKGMVINLTPINTSYPEYCPLISADESMMIVTSKRDGTTGGQRDPHSMEYYEDIYVSYYENSNWTTPENIGTTINTENHDATVGLSPDGQELYIYKGLKKKGDIIPGDLYVCQLKGSEWSSPNALSDNINTNYKESSASVSFDGRILYFTSNKPAGLGGLDIYYSTREPNGQWGPATNAGNIINTPYDEEGVFAHPDGKTLYFSSKGHNTMGGYDIFKTTRNEDNTWSKPVNIGYPINTADDDVFYVMSADGKHGYFSSVRANGKGEKDIYMIKFTEEKDKAETTKLTLLKGKIKDAKTGKPLDAIIEIVDNDKSEILAVFKANSSTGDYLITLPSGKNYGIAVDSEGYLFHSENFNLPVDKDYDRIEMDISLKKISEGSVTILRNLFFDYAKSELKPESVTELNRIVKILNDNANMKIEIGGHTDNQSSLATNEKLSTARAKAVIDFLTKKGIAQNRLSYKGYAYHHPIASNETEEGRAINRRVEFKILSK